MEEWLFRVAGFSGRHDTIATRPRRGGGVSEGTGTRGRKRERDRGRKREGESSMEPSWTQGQVFLAGKGEHLTLCALPRERGREGRGRGSVLPRFKRFAELVTIERIRRTCAVSFPRLSPFPACSFFSSGPASSFFPSLPCRPSALTPGISSFSSFNELPDLLCLPKCRRHPRLRRYHFPIKVEPYALPPSSPPSLSSSLFFKRTGNEENALSHSRIADVTTQADRYAR